MMRFASSMSSSRPVSFHQPSMTCGRTVWPLSMSHWIASVISSSPRARGLDRVDRLEDLRVEQVDADEREVARRVLGLLDQPHDLAVGAQLGHAELVRVGHVREQDLRVAAARAELVHEPGDAVGDQVVAQVHHERLAGHVLLGDLDRVREAERRLLRDVGDRRRPTREPSPSAAQTSSAVSPTMTPMSVMPASRIASIA